MNDDACVADASAILALLKQEPFGRFEPKRLFGATIGTVNLSEVLDRLCSGGLSEAEADEAIATLSLDVVPFDEPQARMAARLRPMTRHVGLSLGDRACLALGLALAAPVVTADRIWADLDLGVEVILVR